MRKQIAFAIVGGFVVNCVFIASIFVQLRFFPYKDKPMMPTTALLLPLAPGIALAQEVAASGLATDLIALIVNTILYAGIIFIFLIGLRAFPK